MYIVQCTWLPTNLSVPNDPSLSTAHVRGEGFYKDSEFCDCMHGELSQTTWQWAPWLILNLAKRNFSKTLTIGTLTTASSVNSWAKVSQSSGLPRSMQCSIRWSAFCTCIPGPVTQSLFWTRGSVALGHLETNFSRNERRRHGPCWTDVWKYQSGQTGTKYVYNLTWMSAWRKCRLICIGVYSWPICC